MEKLLMSFDKAGYESEISGLENLGNQFENIISQFNSIGIGSLSPGEHNLLFINPENLMFNKVMEGKTNDINGLKVNKEKLFELLEKPEGYYPFIDKIKKIIASLVALSESKYSKAFKGKSIPGILGLFSFDNYNEISIKSETLDQVKVLYEIYAETSESIVSFLAATELCKFLNNSENFKNLLISDRSQLTKFIDKIEFTGNPSQPLQPNVQVIKHAASFFNRYPTSQSYKK